MTDNLEDKVPPPPPLCYVDKRTGKRMFRWKKILQQETVHFDLTGREHLIATMTPDQAKQAYLRVTGIVLPNLVRNENTRAIAALSGRNVDGVRAQAIADIKERSPYLQALRRRMDS